MARADSFTEAVRAHGQRETEKLELALRDDLEQVLFSGPAVAQLVREVTDQRNMLDMMLGKERKPERFARQYALTRRRWDIDGARSRGCDGYACDE